MGVLSRDQEEADLFALTHADNALKSRDRYITALESENAELRKRVAELEDELRRVVSGDCSGCVREFERTRACNLCKRMCRDVFEAKP